MIRVVKLLLVSCIFLLFTDSLQSQTNRLNGVVVDAATNDPLPFATVFFNTTTTGTTTDQDGRFTLEVDSRFTELIISYVGYKPLSHQVDIQQLNMRYTFKMEADAQVIEAVEVVSERDQAWYDNLALFEKEFIGGSTFARKTSIENPEALFFDFDPITLRLEAKAREPLKIINKALGYEIEYSLEQFLYDAKNKKIAILGYPRFTELQGNRRKRKRWQRNREKAYKGSPIHFLKSLVAGNLSGEGFELRKLVRKVNPERPTDEQIKMARAISKSRSTPVVIQRNSRDSIADILSRARAPRMIEYLEKNLHDYTMNLKNTSDANFLSFEDHWQVVFTKEVEDVYYLPPGAIFKNRPPAKQQTSVVSMTTDSVEINDLGILDNPLALFFEGYWAFEKMGELLPLNYGVTSKEIKTVK